MKKKTANKTEGAPKPETLKQLTERLKVAKDVYHAVEQEYLAAKANANPVPKTLELFEVTLKHARGDTMDRAGWGKGPLRVDVSRWGWSVEYQISDDESLYGDGKTLEIAKTRFRKRLAARQAGYAAIAKIVGK